MAGEKVKVAIIGVGGMGRAHCKSCQRVEEVELKAVVDVVPECAKEVGEQFGVPYFVNHKDLLDADIVDAVIIATPHYFHPPIAIDAFDAGLHVLSEKPIGVRVGMAERMIKAAQSSGKVFSVMFQRRTEPAVRRARELVRYGALGEIKRTLLISPEFRTQAYYDSGTWRATWAGEGGGVLMNQAPHIMDLFTLFGGMPKKVLGRTRTLMHNIEVEDHAEALLEYENGAFGYFYVSTCDRGPGQLIEIVGDEGKLQFHNGQLSFYRYEPSISHFIKTSTAMWGGPKAERLELQLPPGESGHHVILRNFARAILYGEELIAPGAEGIRSLELANAIILSSHKGEPVEIPIDRGEYHELIDYLCETSTFKKDVKEARRETDPRLGT